MTRWRGVAELVRDAVHHGTLAVEKVHQRVARTPFEVLALAPPLAAPARWLAARQAQLVGGTYTTIRAVNAVAGAIAGAIADAVGQPPRSGGAIADAVGQPPRSGGAVADAVGQPPRSGGAEPLPPVNTSR
jgi:hypothetical protein